MNASRSLARFVRFTLALLTLSPLFARAQAAPAWEPCGWGGGGFYYAAAFHPTKDGTLYLAGDVGGIYKSIDFGKNFRIINRGLEHYGVFTLAVDRLNPGTVYAATEGGLYKSTDEGEQWAFLPRTGRRELRLTGEKGSSIHSVAVHPANGQIVYAGSPGGQVCKSEDGGQSWKVAYDGKAAAAPVPGTRVQFGKVDAQFFGGFWLPLAFPAGLKAAECTGLSFAMKGDKSQPKELFLTLKTSTATFRSPNLGAHFVNDQWHDVALKTEDFTIDPEYVQKHPEAATARLDWATVNRVDFAMSGALPSAASVAHLDRLSFLMRQAAPLVVADAAALQAARTYGNIRLGTGGGSGGENKTVYSVVVTPRNPALVLAATATGLVLSADAGATWRALATPKKAMAATFDPANVKTLYGGFAEEGLSRSIDGGETWSRLGAETIKGAIHDIVINPRNPLELFVIANTSWDGHFYRSVDGGKTWKESRSVKIDQESNPTSTYTGVGDTTPLSAATNLVLNPANPKQLYVSANWRSCWSEDGGATWLERNKGADISCITDIRFHRGEAYVTVMDEGTLKSTDNGRHWQQLWPHKQEPQLAGHNWRIAINEVGGKRRIISTVSPWETSRLPGVVISEDEGRTNKVVTDGLPTYLLRPNTMWGTGYPRALAVDPKDPQIVYLGIDGDAEPGKSGGGLFKSTDGGQHWKQLPSQPASRRMFFGLVVDPADSQRLFWAACGANGGVHRSEDGGASWKSVFSNEQWIFNLHLTPAGALYAAGNNLWRSTDHGATWKQLTKFAPGKQIIGIEVDPRDSKTIWLSSAAGVFKSADDGATWQEITGNLPYRNPMVIRFNPTTNELWAGGVGLHKIAQ